MNNKANLSLEQRIAACKKAHPEWLVYKPELVGKTYTPEERKAQRLAKMQSLRDNWRRGLMVNLFGSVLAVQEDGTVGLFPASTIDDIDGGARWMLQQTNVRKIIALGRFYAVLYRDGTVAAYVQYTNDEEREYLRYAQKQEKEMVPAVRTWTNIVDIMFSSLRGLTALDKDGRLHVVSYTDNVCKEDYLRWAEHARNAVRIDEGHLAVVYYQDAKGKVCALKSDWEGLKRASSWKNDIDVYAFCEFVTAGVSQNGRMITSYPIDHKEFAEIKQWPEIADVQNDGGTLVAVTALGDVKAIGKYASKYANWKNIAFMTQIEYDWIGITWDGACITDNEKLDLSGIDFSWLLK